MNIVICSSMSFKEDVLKIQDILQKRGMDVKIPTECIKEEPKAIASRAHFNRVSNKDTDAILVINKTKNGKDNYIGPNTFAEVAFAFYFKKKIYLLNDIYEPFKDELEAWGVECLRGNIDKIK